MKYKDNRIEKQQEQNNISDDGKMNKLGTS